MIERGHEHVGRWRPDGELLAGLDINLPATLVVGEGNVLFLRGWCLHPRSRATRLQIVANGVAHPVAAVGLVRPDLIAEHFTGRDPRGRGYASGFCALIPFARAEAGLAVELAVQARLRDGTTCCRPLGSIELASEVPSASHRDTVVSARVAICMATYNPPLPLFQRQVQSIREQSLHDWVCLVSDDGSDPEVYAEINRIVGDDSRFRVSRSPERLGFYGNFERCLSLVPAGAEFVALSDHDDRWHPDKLETLLAAFKAETTLVYSDMNIIDDKGTVLSSTYWTTRPNRYDDLSSLLIANTITGAASMFRASLLQFLLPFPQRIGQAFHDQWIACLALSLGPVGYVDRPLYDYVQHSSNVLGHYAPAHETAWAKTRAYARGLSLSGVRATLSGWRSVYYADVQKVKLNACVLQLRCGARLTPEKARQLRRLAKLDEAWATTVWLAFRGLKGMGRVTETLRGEATLLRGLLWRIYARVRSRALPGHVGGLP